MATYYSVILGYPDICVDSCGYKAIDLDAVYFRRTEKAERMTKPKHRGNWLYLPDTGRFINMDIAARIEIYSLSVDGKPERNCVDIIYPVGDELTIFDSDAQAVIDFLIL